MPYFLLCSRLFLLVLLACSAFFSPLATAKSPMAPIQAPVARNFHFYVVGDWPYREADIPAAKALIKAMNPSNPAFTVHVGDIVQPGKHLSCSDANINRARALFNGWQHPWFYTPGDNEWTDCARDAAKFKGEAYEPLDRLAKLRHDFLLPLTDYPFTVTEQCQHYPENRSWAVGNVQFATVHVVGSHNNLVYGRKQDFTEHHASNAANIAWTKSIFSNASKANADAVVLFFHADPNFEGSWDEQLGFTHWIAALSQAAHQFGKPVLLIHGDSHHFRVDQPFLASKNNTYPNAPNVYRLIGHGNPTIAATRVSITHDSDDGAVSFSIRGFTATEGLFPMTVETTP